MAVKKQLFLRDDDAAAAAPAFLRMFRFLSSEKLPAVYAVVPALVSPALVRFFKSRPGGGILFEAAQHGLRHVDHCGNRFMRQEFGPARTLPEQLADMRAGRDLMRKNFGRLFVPVFVPPFHTYNSDTVKAAAAAGLKGLSASKPSPALRGSGLAFLRTRVDVNEYGLDLRPRPLSLERLKTKTVEALKAPGGTVGVYFHHAHITGKDFEVFRAYAAFLKALAGRGLLEPVLFSALLKKFKNI